MNDLKKILLFTVAVVATVFSTFSSASVSIKVNITDIQVQNNRTWINFSPEIAEATTCSVKSSVEVSNDMTNRDLIMSMAMAAMIAGKSVQWLTSNICSNVEKDLITGIKVLN